MVSDLGKNSMKKNRGCNSIVSLIFPSLNPCSIQNPVMQVHDPVEIFLVTVLVGDHHDHLVHLPTQPVHDSSCQGTTHSHHAVN
jgi:hypothetical protein